MQEHQRILELTRSNNLRELGGYPTIDGHTIKWHKLLRSGSLNALTNNDIQNLMHYGVIFDVDFRSRHEIKVAPDPFDEQFVTYHRLSVFPFTDTSTEPTPKAGLFSRLFGQRSSAEPELSSMSKMYQQLVLDSHAQAAYRDLLTVLLNNHDTDGAVLYHCSAGKDRTGVGTLLILSALGVDRETITNDFLLSNQILGLETTTPKRINSNDAQVAAMNAQAIAVESINHIYDVIDQHFGSMTNYLTEAMALKPTEIEQLKNDYLE